MDDLSHLNLIDYDGVEIPFNRSWNSIAVSSSGGADSTLLAHLLCSLITEYNVTIDVHFISHIRMWKTRPWQVHNCENIYNLFNKKFPNIKFYRHVNFISPALEWSNTGSIIKDEYGKITSGEIIEIQSFAEYICFHNDIDAYFNGVTMNPKNVNFKGHYKRDIDSTENNQFLKLKIHMGKIASHPFRFVDKSWVLKTYKKLDLMELFDQTKSCEGEFEGLDYRTYKNGDPVPECGTCFWCKEREWAIEKANNLFRS